MEKEAAMKEMRELRREYRKAKRDIELWGPIIGVLIIIFAIALIVALVVWLVQQWWFWVAVGIVALSVISWKWPKSKGQT